MVPHGRHTPWYPWSGLETGATLEDFFLMETGRIFLRGEPPFRETCDMLCPDALGAVPVNQAPARTALGWLG